MVRRTLAGRSKKPNSSDSYGSMLFGVLNFHLVISLANKSYVSLEAVIVDRTTSMFEDLLTAFRRRLSIHGPNAQSIDPMHSIGFIVSDMAVPFAIAVIRVFNQMTIPDSMAVLLCAANTGTIIVVSQHIRSLLVWCGVHGDRALFKFAKDSFSADNPVLQNDMALLLLNITLALMDAKSYSDLSLVVGFSVGFFGMNKFQNLCDDSSNQIKTIVSGHELMA